MMEKKKSNNFLKFAIFLMVMGIFISSCSLSFFVPDKNESNKSQTFKMNFDANGWDPIDPDSSDYAYLNKSTQSILMANSLCKKYEATELQDLLSNMLGGIQDLKIHKEESIPYQDREAFRSEAEGQLDGVKVSLIIQTFKKNRCIYDFVLITPSAKARDEGRKYFEQFLNSAKID